jgi:hypothetical protein
LGRELAIEILEHRGGGIAAALNLLRRQIGCLPEPSSPPPDGDDGRV